MVRGRNAAASKCTRRWPNSNAHAGSPPANGCSAGAMTQADITAACVYSFLTGALAIHGTAVYPGLAALAERCEALPEFHASKAEWFAPGEG